MLPYAMTKRCLVIILILASLSPRVILGAETIRLCSFNIQIFGAAKMAKPEVVRILTDIISQADVTAVQEVRSRDIRPVVQFMQLLPPNYAYVLGPREGRSGSKEQYWIIYDRTKLRLLGEQTWADPEDLFERNPLGAYFQARDAAGASHPAGTSYPAGASHPAGTSRPFDFILINNHIRPSNAARELAALPLAVRYFQELWDERDVVLAGDFNADGMYYDETALAAIFPEHAYHSIITNGYDTTVAAGDNTYDRIIITASAIEDYTGACGVIRFDALYDFSALTIRPSQVSDHYPVWADFYDDADTD